MFNNKILELISLRDFDKVRLMLWLYAKYVGILDEVTNAIKDFQKAGAAEGETRYFSVDFLHGYINGMLIANAAKWPVCNKLEYWGPWYHRLLKGQQRLGALVAVKE